MGREQVYLFELILIVVNDVIIFQALPLQ